MNLQLVNTSLAPAAAFKASILALLLTAGLAHASCDHLFLGDPTGSTYSTRGASAVGWMSHRRNDVRTTGLDEVLSRGTEHILFVANHQSIIDALVALGEYGGPTSLRPILAAHRLDGPLGRLLKFGMNRFNGVAIPSVLQRGRTVAPTIFEVIDRIANELARGQNFLLFYNGFVQRTVEDAPQAGRALYEIVRRYPNVRIVLVRQRGSWGSRWSFGFPTRPGRALTNSVIGRGLIQTLLDLPISLIKPLPRRTITFDFTEADDFPRAGTRRDIHEYVQKHYAAVPERLTLVPRY